MSKHSNPLAAPEFAPMIQKYMAAQRDEPHRDKMAYAALLEQQARQAHAELASGFKPVGQTSGGDTILAVGKSPNGGMEMLVKKSDGVVVLLLPDLPQVVNTPQGPKMKKSAAPLELPLVRRLRPKESVIQHCRAWGQVPPPALLLFQGRFNTAAREIQLQ